jgi:hypothetical protein
MQAICWCLNTENSYLVDFQLYTGRQCSDSQYHKVFGKPAAVLVRMADDIKGSHLPYQFFFDNLFTSVNLVSHFNSLGFGATGTMRANRIPKDLFFFSLRPQ